MNEIESQISFKKIKNRKTEPDQLCFIDLSHAVIFLWIAVTVFGRHYLKY